ncbi:MAG: AsmA family protein [Parasphingopyxis sp.]|uniref:AsmA family protein n=1 Tax=Parasphingopyxis sp. TaxID=1920299 RepID=UPI003F9F1E83
MVSSVSTRFAEIRAFLANPPKRVVRGLLYAITGFFAVLLLAWFILYVTKGSFLKQPFERIVSAQLDREVRVGGDFHLYLNPIDIQFLAEDMTIANPGWAESETLFKADRIASRVATLPLIFGSRRVRWLELVNGDIALEWSPDGERNSWTFGESRGEPLELPMIRYAAIRGTELHYRDPAAALSADVAFETIRARDSEFENAIRFSGDGRARGEAFTLAGGFFSPNAMIAGGRNQFRLHAEGVNTVFDVSGVLPGLTEIEGADLEVRVRGGNMADLFDFAGIAVPETRAYRLRSQLTKAGNEWRFTDLTGQFGDSDLAGWMTVAMREPRMMITAELSSDTADIIDFGPFIGYSPERLDAEGGSGAIRTVNGAPRVLPDAPLRTDALARFDAHVDYRVHTVRAESLPISNVSMTVDLDDRLLRLSPLEFDVAGGHLTSDIQIDARQDVVRTSYDVRLSPTPMGTLLAQFGAEQNGTTGTIQGRVQLVGSGNTVHDSLSTASGRIAIIMPQGSLVAGNTQLAELDIGTFVQLMFEDELDEPIEINCGLIGFTVRNGLAAADPILVDTRKNVIVGRGGFSFRTEALDLAVEADGKDFSLFSGQSPVGINGYFAAPGIDPISGELLARAGAAIGLGAIVSPLAAVIAFVDIGDAEPADCGPVLSGARAHAQREADGDPREDVGDGRADGEEEDDDGPLGLGIF